MLESMTQLVRNLPELKEEEYIKKIIGSKIERKVRNWKNYIIEILDKEPHRFFIPGKDQKDLYAFQREVINAFIEHYIIPKQEKGGTYSFYGIKGIESQKLSLDELKEKEPELWKWLKENHNYIIENKRKKKITVKILRIPVPKLQDAEKELQSELNDKKEKSEKGECLICLSNKELTPSGRLSKIFGWLVKAEKNIAPIYSHSGEWYEKSIRVCIDCAKKLEAYKEYISLGDTNIKFIDFEVKIFPYYEGKEKFDIIKFWKDINLQEKNLDLIIEKYIPEIERISERISLTLVFFQRNNNKQDIVMMEKTKFSTLIQAYKIFKKWKEENNGNFEYLNLFGENSILSNLKYEEMENNALILDLVKKIIKLDKIDRTMKIKLLGIFNKITRKNTLKNKYENVKKIKSTITTLNFLEYYNEYIENNVKT